MRGGTQRHTMTLKVKEYFYSCAYVGLFFTQNSSIEAILMEVKIARTISIGNQKSFVRGELYVDSYMVIQVWQQSFIIPIISVSFV